LRFPYPRLWKCTRTFTKEPKTQSDHIRKHRLERHILRTQLAKLLGVDRISIQNWAHSDGRFIAHKSLSSYFYWRVKKCY